MKMNKESEILLPHVIINIIFFKKNETLFFKFKHRKNKDTKFDTYVCIYKDKKDQGSAVSRQLLYDAT